MSDLTVYDLVGKRIKMIEMKEDPDPIEPGEEGLVISAGGDILQVKWDNGRSLGVVLGVDEFEILK